MLLLFSLYATLAHPVFVSISRLSLSDRDICDRGPIDRYIGDEAGRSRTLAITSRLRTRRKGPEAEQVGRGRVFSRGVRALYLRLSRLPCIALKPSENANVANMSKCPSARIGSAASKRPSYCCAAAVAHCTGRIRAHCALRDRSISPLLPFLFGTDRTPTSARETPRVGSLGSRLGQCLPISINPSPWTRSDSLGIVLGSRSVCLLHLIIRECIFRTTRAFNRVRASNNSRFFGPQRG